MFVWVGINVEEQLKETRMAVDGVLEKIAISNVTCQLPLHISLKISFNIENELFESVLKDIESIYQAQKPFEIDIKGIEKHENIMWIRMYSNAEIEELATKLNLMLKEKYNIPLHEYDLDFIFHTTLFMDDDAEKINIAHNLLGDLALPQTLMANRFVIGTSETGENGTYRVYKTIEVNNMNDNLPKRKGIRLKEYDYSEMGLYFVTICTDKRRKILSNIVGVDVPDDPRVELTVYGKIADKFINQLNDFYDNISVEQYVIMPNHIHIILFVRNNGSSGTSTPTVKQHSAVPAFVSTFKRFSNKEIGENIWQRYYYDHIIRNKHDYEEISKYIHENPLKWQYDELWCGE